jgi:choline dehydrogenase-like flavoprotein
MVKGGSQIFPSHAQYLDGFGAEYKRTIKKYHPAWVIVYARGEPLQTFNSHVEIDENVVDATGIPVLRIHYERTENDRRILNDAFQNLQELMHDAGAEILSADEFLSTPGAISHEMGTTRMGRLTRTARLCSCANSRAVWLPVTQLRVSIAPLSKRFAGSCATAK